MSTNTAEARKAKPPREEARPQREELRAAYEAHTLARILFGHLAAVRPWTVPPGPTGLDAPLHGFWPH